MRCVTWFLCSTSVDLRHIWEGPTSHLQITNRLDAEREHYHKEVTLLKQDIVAIQEQSSMAKTIFYQLTHASFSFFVHFVPTGTIRYGQLDGVYEMLAGL